MSWRGLSRSSPKNHGETPPGSSSGDAVCKEAPDFVSILSCPRVAAKLELKLVGLLRGGVEFVEGINSAGETSPSGVVGEDTTMGNRTSTIGLDMLFLLIELRGFFCSPKRRVSSVRENARFDNRPPGSFASSHADNVAGDVLALRRSVSMSARSPSDVLLRFVRIEAIAGPKVVSRVVIAS